MNVKHRYCEICDTHFKTMREINIHRKQLQHFKISTYEINEKIRQEELKANKDISVQCQLCFTYHKQLSDRHLKKHNVSSKQYKIMFPGFPTISNKTLEKQKNKKYSEESKNKIKNSHLERLKDPIIKAKTKHIRQIMNENYSKEQISEWARQAGKASVKSEKSWVNNPHRSSKIETSFLDFVENCFEKLCYLIKITRQYHLQLEKERRIDGVLKFRSFNIFVEVDGNYWHNYPYGLVKDMELDCYCEQNNIKLFRFWENAIIKDRKKCADEITSYIIDELWFRDAIEIFGADKIHSKEFHDFLYGVEENA
jgi:very-short-patch-repair endonuclease